MIKFSNRFTSQLQALTLGRESGSAPSLTEMVEVLDPEARTKLFRASFGILELIGQRNQDTRLKIYLALMEMSEIEMDRFLQRFGLNDS